MRTKQPTPGFIFDYVNEYGWRLGLKDGPRFRWALYDHRAVRPVAENSELPPKEESPEVFAWADGVIADLNRKYVEKFFALFPPDK